MKISVSSYSFNPLIKKAGLTQEASLKYAYSLGFRAIEFTDISGENFDEQKENALNIRKTADELGMEITAYVIFADFLNRNTAKEIQRVKNQLQIAKILGVPFFRHDIAFFEKEDEPDFDDTLKKVCPIVREISEYAKTLGIKTLTENHGYFFQDSFRMEALYKAVDCDNFGLLVDMGNFVCADEDSLFAVKRLLPYISYVHAKDMKFYPRFMKNCSLTRNGQKFRGVTISKGIIPVFEILKLLQDSGYDGIVSLEYEGRKPCIREVKKGFKKLNSYLEKI